MIQCRSLLRLDEVVVHPLGSDLKQLIVRALLDHLARAHLVRVGVRVKGER